MIMVLHVLKNQMNVLKFIANEAQRDLALSRLLSQFLKSYLLPVIPNHPKNGHQTRGQRTLDSHPSPKAEKLSKSTDDETPEWR